MEFFSLRASAQYLVQPIISIMQHMVWDVGAIPCGCPGSVRYKTVSAIEGNREGCPYEKTSLYHLIPIPISEKRILPPIGTIEEFGRLKKQVLSSA